MSAADVKVEEFADEKSDAARFALKSSTKGAWVRASTAFHGKVSASGETEFPAEKGRYHLIVADGCPWAHRTRIVRALKGLEDVIPMSIVGHFLTCDVPIEEHKGWLYDEDHVDPLFGASNLGEIYEKASPGFRQKYLDAGAKPYYSVPVLFDTKTNTIVSNESVEIIEMFNTEFNEWAKYPDLDLAPNHLREEMESVDSLIYPNINDGVYRCGFAKSQEAYEEAYASLWKAMDVVEELLGARRYIAGDRFTLSDIRLFTTILRMDHVYYVHFKVNRNRVVDMPNIWAWCREVYHMTGIADTFDAHMVKKHYFMSHGFLNPTRHVPVGPNVSYDEPHNRDSRSYSYGEVSKDLSLRD